MGLEVGGMLPDFELINANETLSGKSVKISGQMKDNGIVVMFECNHCPYVVASIERINTMAKYCEDNQIGFIGINSNDSSVYESDSLENMISRANKGMPYPYLHDKSQEVAHKFGAKRTPEFFLFDRNSNLVYVGRMDDSPRNPNEVTSTELKDAIDSILTGKQPIIQQTESIGCSVKWKA